MDMGFRALEALALLANKVESAAPRKHGNMPL